VGERGYTRWSGRSEANLSKSALSDTLEEQKVKESRVAFKINRLVERKKRHLSICDGLGREGEMTDVRAAAQEANHSDYLMSSAIVPERRYKGKRR
jgi:hypothetical protein